MLDKEETDKIIDRYVLKFLDNYANTYGVLPESNLVETWRMGFISGCQAVSDAIVNNSLNRPMPQSCGDCNDNCPTCDSKKSSVS